MQAIGYWTLLDQIVNTEKTFSDLDSANKYIDSLYSNFKRYFKNYEDDDVKDVEIDEDEGTLSWKEAHYYGRGWIAPNGAGHQYSSWFKYKATINIEVVGR